MNPRPEGSPGSEERPAALRFVSPLPPETPRRPSGSRREQRLENRAGASVRSEPGDLRNERSVAAAPLPFRGFARRRTGRRVPRGGGVGAPGDPGERPVTTPAGANGCFLPPLPGPRIVSPLPPGLRRSRSGGDRGFLRRGYLRDSDTAAPKSPATIPLRRLSVSLPTRGAPLPGLSRKSSPPGANRVAAAFDRRRAPAPGGPSVRGD